MKHTKFPALFMAVAMLMGILTVPASAEGFVSGGAIGYPTDASDCMLSVDDDFRNYCERRAEATGCKDIIDYENLTIEFADKDGNSFGYKCIWDRTTRMMTYYDPEGNIVTGTGINIWAENPFESNAKENLQSVKVDGKDVTFAMYSPDNGGTNYIRLVDLAVALRGTAGQFNVGYGGMFLDRVLLTAGEAYEGAAAAAPFHGEMAYTMLGEPTYVNGVAQDLEAIRFEYQNGGYTYYKLRDLGEALGFNVGWDRVGEFIYIESDKPYDPTN